MVDVADFYLIAFTTLLSMCVFFLKKHVDGQDKLNTQVEQLLRKVEVIENNSKNASNQIEHISNKIDDAHSRLNEHDIELSFLRSKML